MTFLTGQWFGSHTFWLWNVSRRQRWWNKHLVSQFSYKWTERSLDISSSETYRCISHHGTESWGLNGIGRTMIRIETLYVFSYVNIIISCYTYRFFNALKTYYVLSVANNQSLPLCMLWFSLTCHDSFIISPWFSTLKNSGHPVVCFPLLQKLKWSKLKLEFWKSTYWF